MPKLKIKVYFYHLIILTVLMAVCFYFVHRDMKRIEENVLRLYNRCNDLDILNKNLVTRLTLQNNNEEIDDDVEDEEEVDDDEEEDEEEEVDDDDDNEEVDDEDVEEVVDNVDVEEVVDVVDNVDNVEVVNDNVNDNVVVEEELHKLPRDVLHKMKKQELSQYLLKHFGKTVTGTKDKLIDALLNIGNNEENVITDNNNNNVDNLIDDVLNYN